MTEDAVQVDRAAAPELFALVERVAAAVGAPMPEVDTEVTPYQKRIRRLRPRPPGADPRAGYRGMGR